MSPKIPNSLVRPKSPGVTTQSKEDGSPPEGPQLRVSPSSSSDRRPLPQIPEYPRGVVLEPTLHPSRRTP